MKFLIKNTSKEGIEALSERLKFSKISYKEGLIELYFDVYTPYENIKLWWFEVSEKEGVWLPKCWITDDGRDPAQCTASTTNVAQFVEDYPDLQKYFEYMEQMMNLELVNLMLLKLQKNILNPTQVTLSEYHLFEGHSEFFVKTYNKKIKKRRS